MSDGDMLSKYERENLLLKLEKEFAYAGARIPAVVEADGERIRLRDLVFRMSKKRGQLTPADLEEVEQAISVVRRKRKEIVLRISRDGMTVAEAKELFGTATGLDRALDALYNAPLPKPSLAEESRKAKLEDGRRWMELVKRVYGREDRRKRD
jgi:uncharacterized protein (DUF2267 family)